MITSTYALLSSHLYAYLQQYMQSFRFSSLHLSFVFLFFFEQDGYEVKVAFVSNRFENLLEDVVFLDGIQLKTQNTTFKSFTDDLTVLQYRYYYFHTPHKFDGGGFFSQITTLKTVPSDEKSKLPYMRRRVSNAL